MNANTDLSFRERKSVPCAHRGAWWLLLGLTFIACAPSAKESAPAASPVTISVAASTKEVVESLAAEFTAQKGVAVKVNPGASSGLAAQIIEGAPVDLFLSANRELADEVEKAGLAQTSGELLTNRLVLVVNKKTPADIREPKDLLSPSVKKLALAGEKVPAGKYADQALGKLELLEGLNAAGKIARAQDVRGALHFVEQGEAEAGVVYATDAIGAEVKVIHEFDPALHDEIVYVLVLLKRAADNPSVKAFYEYLQSDSAKATYRKAGFLPATNH